MEGKGALLLLRMLAKQMPLEVQLNSLKEAVEECILVPTQDNKAEVANRATMVIMALGDEEKSLSDIMSEEQKRMQDEEIKGLFFPKESSEE